MVCVRLKRTQLNRTQACARLACAQMKRAQSFRAQSFLIVFIMDFFGVYFEELICYNCVDTSKT
jgi:hypothetical protein